MFHNVLARVVDFLDVLFILINEGIVDLASSLVSYHPTEVFKLNLTVEKKKNK